jgi:hypothetical protein
MNSVLSSIQFLNISLDGWTDGTLRSFNGYIAQGIDNDWVLHSIPIAFEPVTGEFCEFI